MRDTRYISYFSVSIHITGAKVASAVVGGSAIVGLDAMKARNKLAGDSEENDAEKVGFNLRE